MEAFFISFLSNTIGGLFATADFYQTALGWIRNLIDIVLRCIVAKIS